MATILLVVAVVLGLGACGDDEALDPPGSSGTTAPTGGSGVRAAPPSGEPSITGPIASTSASTILVQDGVDPDGRALAASVRVPTDIAILQEDGQGGWNLAGAGDLTEGARVQIWFDGPVAESYPVQAKAGSIVILA